MSSFVEYKKEEIWKGKEKFFEISGCQGTRYGDRVYFIEKTRKDGRETTCFKMLQAQGNPDDWKLSYAQPILAGITDMDRLNENLLMLRVAKTDMAVVYNMEKNNILYVGHIGFGEQKPQVGKFVVGEDGRMIARGMPVNYANYEPEKGIIHTGIVAARSAGCVYLDLSRNAFIIKAPERLRFSDLENVKQKFGLEDEVVDVMYRDRFWICDENRT